MLEISKKALRKGESRHGLLLFYVFRLVNLVINCYFDFY